MVIFVMVALGIAIGLINISNSEGTRFMIAVLVLGVGTGSLATWTFISGLSKILTAILSNVAMVTVPAGLVVAIKSMYKDAR